MTIGRDRGVFGVWNDCWLFVVLSRDTRNAYKPVENYIGRAQKRVFFVFAHNSDIMSTEFCNNKLQLKSVP